MKRLSNTLRTNTRGFRSMALIGAVAAAVAFAAPVPARAWSRARTLTPEILQAHEVKDAVSPRGIHVDLHDYWIAGEDQEDKVNPSGYESMGVNRVGGDRKQLIFGNNVKGGINQWTGSSKPYAGIVDPNLGGDGYPSLAAGNPYRRNGESALTSAQSLKYLFDGTDYDGKRSHLDTEGLLRLDSEGYYYYDSQRNFASYDAGSNSFTLYDAGAVVGGGRDKQVGQFFPFNTADQVFKDELDGKLRTEKYSTHGHMRHYFGLTMSANFMQPEDGKTKNGKDMVFEFAGDDDVWVFIDGVLVGDVGGVHDRTGLKINFATGEVYTYDGSSNGSPDAHYNPTTIKEMFRRAQGPAFDPAQFKGDTFDDGGYHTLGFYYLERGNANSNLALKFNLVTVAESTMTKVDQLGKPVDGARFDLYATDGTYEVPEGARPVATGTTDRLGGFSFKGVDGKPLNFMALYHRDGTEHYLLRETSAPSGYRKSPDGKLRFVMSEVEKTLGFLFSDNYWESGVFARPEQQLTIEGDVVRGAKGTAAGSESYPVDEGTVFAVIYRQVTEDGKSGWRAMSGSTAEGWKASGQTPGSVTDLRDAQLHVFEDRDKDGKFELDMRDMPGNPEDYYMMTGDESKSEYSVGFYYTNLGRDGSFDRKKIDAGNTFRLDGGQFSRQTAANLYVTDVKQLLGVQKVDDDGVPVNGAKFGVYTAGSMVDAGGCLVPAPNAVPISQGVTEDHDGASVVEGKALCYLGPFDPGAYYLVEMEAPVGHVRNETATRVLVDAQGVHVDAGTADDGVSALVSMGSLVDSMASFAAKDDTDMTLYDVVASCRTARSDQATVNPDGSVSIAWTEDDDPTDDIWMTSGASEKVLDYGADLSEKAPSATYGMVAYHVSEGLAMCGVRQNTAYGPGGVAQDPARYGVARWDNLGDRDLTSLYTGATCVVVENRRVASLAVTKKVELPEGLTGPTEPDGSGGQVSALDQREFTLSFKLVHDGAPLSGPYPIAWFEQTEDGRVRIDDGGQTLQLDAEGVGSAKISDGQTVEVYGLPAGTEYRVCEPGDGMPKGFIQKKAAGEEGVIEEGETQRAEFTNAYSPDHAIVQGSTAFPVEKEYDHWRPGDVFSFTLRGEDGAPMPADARDGAARLELSRSSSTAVARGSFGNIEYALPGRYFYYITEERPDKAAPGVTYSDALYLVTVTVVENAAEGRLEASSAMRCVRDDAGEPVPSRPGAGPARFVNRFEAEQVGFAPAARKEYVDHAGSRPLEDDMFEFVIEVPKGAPMPSDDGAPKRAQENMTFELGNKGSTVQARQAWFTGEDVGETYRYIFYEKLPDAAREAPHVADGVTYDPVRYCAEVKVEAEGSGDQAKVKLNVEYRKVDADGTLGDKVAEPVFHNEFEAKPATDVSIAGVKHLRGRKFLERDSFEFALAAADGVTAAAIADGAVVLDPSASSEVPVECLVQRVTSSSADAGDDGKAFAFEGLAFKRVGTYRFAVNEVVPQDSDGDADGLAYDRHASIVTVTVEEGDSAAGTPQLVAKVTCENGAASQRRDRVEFTNVYRAYCTSDAVSLTVCKTLDGGKLEAGDFSFVIEGVDDDSRAKLLNESDRRFANARPDASGVSSMEGKLSDLLFAQDDAGKTFSYEIREELPEGADAGHPSSGGVTYDLSRFVIELAPEDAGDGSMSIAARVFRTREADGEECEPVLLGTFDGSRGDRPVVAFANSYAPAPATVPHGWAPFAKRLEGRPWDKGDAFSFEMERVSYQVDRDAPVQSDGPAFDAMPLPGRATVTMDDAPYEGDESARVFAFGEMTFHAPGIYTYRVREAKPAAGEALPGMAYSNAAAMVSVTVVDVGAGRLVAYVDVVGVGEDELATFVNVYTPVEQPGPGPDPSPGPEIPDPDDGQAGGQVPAAPDGGGHGRPGEPGVEASHGAESRVEGKRLPQAGDPWTAGAMVFACSACALFCAAAARIMRRR